MRGMYLGATSDRWRRLRFELSTHRHIETAEPKNRTGLGWCEMGRVGAFGPIVSARAPNDLYVRTNLPTIGPILGLNLDS